MSLTVLAPVRGCESLQREAILVNKYDLIFFIVFVLFFFSENRMDLPFLDNAFTVIEHYKLKYAVSLIGCAYFMLSLESGERLFREEFSLYLKMILFVIGLSLISIITGRYRGDLINEGMYFSVPLFFSYSAINAKKGTTDSLLNIAFWMTASGFFFKFRHVFSPSSLSSISFAESYSPFEGELAFQSVLFVILYAWKRDRLKYLLSLVICLLSFKRLSILAVLIFSLSMNRLRGGEKPKAGIRTFILAAFLLFPVGIHILLSDSFSELFSAVTGLDLDSFVMSRSLFMRTVLEEYPFFGGLGSVRSFLSEYMRGYYHTNVSIYDLHCDIMRFYLECSLIGLFSLLYAYIKSARSKIALAFVTYIFLESCVNHMFGAGRTMYWIIAYLMIFEFNRGVPYEDIDTAHSSR